MVAPPGSLPQTGLHHHGPGNGSRTRPGVASGPAPRVAGSPARRAGHAFLPGGKPAVAVRGGGSAIIAADYDSVSANRGSPVFNQSKQVIGVHNGSRCSAPYGPVAVASAECHNDFSLFGEALRQRVAEALRRISG